MPSLTSKLNLSFINFLLLSCLPTTHHCEKSEFTCITTQSCLLSKTEPAPILHPLFTGQVEPYRQPPHWWPPDELTLAWNIERSLGRKNTFIKYFAFTGKKKKKSLKMFLFCFVLRICIFSFLVEQNYLFPQASFPDSSYCPKSSSVCTALFANSVL